MHNLTKIRLFRVLLWITYPISLVILWPLALLRKKSDARIFFFLDRYAIGDAQRIHIDILHAIEDVNKVVYFTRYSANDKMKQAFYSVPNTRSKDIHFWCDNLAFRLFAVHYFAFYVNRHAHAQVFSANSTFFYDMLPFLAKKLHKTELLHNFTFGKKGMEFFGLANHKYLDNRITYDSFTASNIEKQYREYGIDAAYLSRLVFIEPGVQIPPPPNKDFNLPLKVLYAGRGGKQKRIHLINRIVEQCLSQGVRAEFHFAGTMYEELTGTVKKASVYHGEISDQKEMLKLYDKTHLLLLTSAYEGFPMVIKESMAAGSVPVVTALPGNTMHLKHLENAWLIKAIENEDEVVALGVEAISKLASDLDYLQQLSIAAYEYAAANFSKDRFDAKYRRFFKLTVDS